ncbi:ABC transporter ATP-binding protein [Leptolyngbya sp. AN02str]|uniref:ABC transporter ATP-binding protein n=1 Tax=Leptolyngbya sp. AN02str TaxID=3423363 RepID=UPI003D31F5BB
MSTASILLLDQVFRQFPGAAYPAVHQVSLTLVEGDVLALLGPSGCGKTTLLRMIAGFEQPQHGTIELAGQTVACEGRMVPPERRSVGMVFQDFALFPHLTVGQNIAFGLQQVDPKTQRDRVKEAIALVGLQGLEQRFPHELSGGQQQRVALARALAPRPALLLLDEPLSNLDVQVRLYLRQEVREILKATGTSAIFVTHDQEEAMAIADYIAVMRQGSLEQQGTPEEIYQQPRSRFVAEFVTQANFIPAIHQGTHWHTEIGQFDASLVHAMEEGLHQGELMLRQEAIIPIADDQGNVIVGDRQFLGREYRYSLITPSGRKLYARTSTKLQLAKTSRVRLEVTDASIPLFTSTQAMDWQQEIPASVAAQ